MDIGTRTWGRRPSRKPESILFYKFVMNVCIARIQVNQPTIPQDEKNAKTKHCQMSSFVPELTIAF